MANYSTNKLKVVLADNYTNTRAINLMNPKSSLTLSGLNTTFKSAFDSDVILTTAGYPTKAVQSAQRIITTGTDIE